jgi:GT2 family glycosyltransferase
MTTIQDKERIAVVIPVHNRKDFTRDCLSSLYEQTIPVDLIVVVDDGSTDGTAEMIRSEFPEVIIHFGNGNLFWTAAINIGIAFALNRDADYILTMNNDTVASPDFVEKMVEGISTKPHAILGALDRDIKTGKPYYGGEIINWLKGSSEFLLDVLPTERQNGLHEVSLYPGRGLLIPRIVFDTIGLFAEDKLPHYMADYDFTLQARKRGFEIFCNYDAVLYTYPEEGGDHKIRKNKTFRNYFDHLFGIKGGGNLINFTIYAFRNCPKKSLFVALLTGYTRRIIGFWLK